MKQPVALHPTQAELNRIVLEAHNKGFQVAVHAVTENAVSSACEAIEYALREFPKPDHRHRIEHCSVCSPSLAGRIAEAGIMVVTQPQFIHYNGDRYLNTVPEDGQRYLYAIRTLIDNGVEAAMGTDFPITPPDIIMGIFAASARSTLSGRIISPGERISPLKAIELCTNSAARAIFEDNERGSITPGKRADLVVLDKDPVSIPTDRSKILRLR